MLYVGPGLFFARHAHHSIQIAIALEGSFRIRLEGRAVERRVAIVPARARHELDARGLDIAVLHVDPDGLDGRALAERATRGLLERRRIEDPLRELAPIARDARSHAEAARFGDAVIRALADPTVPVRARHPAVKRALAIAQARPDEPLRLATLASELGLSPRWLSTIFRAEVGLPLRRYVLWARLRRAADSLGRGAKVGEAAHAAGFADAAHLSRTFHAAFGSSPSELMALVDRNDDGRNVQAAPRRAP